MAIRIFSFNPDYELNGLKEEIAKMKILDKLKATGKTLKNEIKVYQLVLKDRRTHKLAKILLGLAVCYTLLPFDIIPDFIPVIGHLDDVIIVPVLVILSLKMIPKEVVEECRIRVSKER